jgi:hypothetical protein
MAAQPEPTREDEKQAARLDSDMLTERQTQKEELPMSLAWFRRKRLLGDGPPFVRVSNRIFYRRGEIRSWLAARRTQ